MVYFALFFSMASYYPLLGKYYKELSFSGTEIGFLFSTATFATMVFQPIWGIICDKRGKCKNSFLLMQLSVIFIALAIPFIRNYWILLIAIAMHFSFQCGLFPILDTIIYKDIHDFGEIRLWGSLGFSLMVLFSGKLSEIIGINNMFFIYSFTTMISLIISLRINEVEIEQKESNKLAVSKVLKELCRKNYIIFLFSGFLLMGTFMTGGAYYSILFAENGGNMTVFGISYFFIAISEIPFLKFSKAFIRKYGTERVILFSGIILLMRFTIYAMSKSYITLLISSVFMGSFIGLILPAIADYLKNKIKDTNRATAVTLFTSISTGLGPMLFQFSGGIIYEKLSLSILYFFLCCVVIIGIISTIFLIESSEQKHHIQIIKEKNEIY